MSQADGKWSYIWQALPISYLKNLSVSFIVLLLTGVLSNVWQAGLWERVSQHHPEVRVDDLAESVGQGLVLGLVGGFRSVMADFLFLRAYVYWEHRDLAKMQAAYELALSVDPRSLPLWLNSARVIAYDTPVWRIRKLQETQTLTTKQLEQIHAEQAHYALQLIDRAAKFHHNDYRIALEKAQIYMHKLGDDESAAYYYKQAGEMDGAPYYAGRVYAELLRRNGQPEAAHEYLVSVYPSLPDDEPAASKAIVLERIRQLEKELNIPLSLRMRP